MRFVLVLFALAAVCCELIVNDPLSDEELARYAAQEEPQDMPVPVEVTIKIVSYEESMLTLSFDLGKISPERDDQLQLNVNGQMLENDNIISQRTATFEIRGIGEIPIYAVLTNLYEEILATSPLVVINLENGAKIVRTEEPASWGNAASSFDIRRRLRSAEEEDPLPVFHAWLSRNEEIAGVEPRPVGTVSGQVASPTISPAGGVFDEEVFVSLTCATPGATLFYAAQGGPFLLYQSPFLWTRGGSTRFVLAAARSGMADSEIVESEEFIINVSDLSRTPRNGKNLVLAVATRKWVPIRPGLYEPAQGDRDATLAMYARFGGSLRRHGFTDDISVGVHFKSPLESAVGELVDELGITQVPLETFINEATINNITSVFWTRYFFYLAYLEANWDLYRHGNVILSDFRDVYFQRNPFQGLNTSSPQELHYYRESAADQPATLVKHTFVGQANWYWLSTCYGEDFVMQHEGDPVSCSGVVVGSAQAVHSYLREITMQFIDLRRRMSVWCYSKVGSDQGVHNYLFMTNSLLRSVKMFENDHGVVKTVGTSPTFRNHIGQVLNADGSVPSIIHQYDRIPQLKSMVDGMFPYFPDATLLQQPVEQFQMAVPSS